MKTFNIFEKPLTLETKSGCVPVDTACWLHSEVKADNSAPEKIPRRPCCRPRRVETTGRVTGASDSPALSQSSQDPLLGLSDAA